MKTFTPIAAVLAAAFSLPAAAAALADCRGIADNAQRLACYDTAVGRAAQPTVAPASASASAPAPSAAAAESAAAPDQASGRRLFATYTNYQPQTMSERWELEPETKGGTFQIRPYEPVYVLPASWRHQVNRQPCSANPSNCAATPVGDTYGHTEIKFQLSFKTKVWEEMFGSGVDWWAAYTQQSYWQAYDKVNSSPFRESDYQPETWLTVPMKVGPEWLQLRMVNLGVVHQSNGQTDPLSRSWNRVYATFGLASGDLSVLIKPWWRIKESLPDDNNPDITDYVGRMEVRAVYPWGQNVFSATLRNNLKFGNGTTPNRSFVQGEWAFPLYGRLHGYVQAFHGYGESLQNYNFRNSGVGVGVSLVEWR